VWLVATAYHGGATGWDTRSPVFEWGVGAEGFVAAGFIDGHGVHDADVIDFKGGGGGGGGGGRGRRRRRWKKRGGRKRRGRKRRRRRRRRRRKRRKRREEVEEEEEGEEEQTNSLNPTP